MTTAELDEILISLGATYKRKNASAAIVQLELWMGFKLHPLHYHVLQFVGDYISFEKGCDFVPLNPTGLEGDGNLGIDYLLGPGKGKDGIKKETEAMRDRLPVDFIAFGKAFGGADLIGRFRSDAKIYYWHHEAPWGEEFTVVAEDFEDLLLRLRPAPPEPPLEYANDADDCEVTLSEELRSSLDEFRRNYNKGRELHRPHR